MHLHDLMEPEETVGKIWHDMANGIGATVSHPEAGVTLVSVRPSLAVLFRALGGGAGVELTESPATVTRHRQAIRRKLGAERDREYLSRFDGERLALPPFFAAFPDADLNRAAYFWLTASAAVSEPAMLDLPDEGPARDCAQIRANARSADRTYELCPGLRELYARMTELCAGARPNLIRPASETAMERAIRDQLCGESADMDLDGEPVSPSRGHRPFAPVPIWLTYDRPGTGGAAPEEAEEGAPPPPGTATTTRKLGERQDNEQNRRSDSFIMHRFESILSWVESMNINRSVHDDDDENAQKAAEDQDRITLNKHDRKTATRLRLHLDLSPADADHEALAGVHTYPEWNHRTRSYMEGHCRVLDAPAQPSADDGFRPDPRRIRAVRRQFEALRPRRILQPRQVEGSELDLDALLTSRADLRATGRGSDRIWQAARQTERDLSVAFLVDMSRSTEAAIGETSVIDVAREAVAGLAAGIDAAGDRLGVWGFSSLRRDRVFLTRIKPFDTPFTGEVEAGIAAMRPGHYTRLGAAIRHASAQLAEQPSARKLLLVLTDGKPNDLDHYEGQHGIEDSRMAVREARRAGQSLHGIVIDEDGQDWFARIFGRGGFTLLPDPKRLVRALPDIYRSLIQES
ncbi:von Willebrand factor type A domain protein [Jannaschia aquimarina]|uniref:von Willebrand factor type A domain protein n=1 Tax=Jannaschia aquimarina TaxID=935700 RepID=A0A0D1EFS3_9RHOB|nr:VWA domain-containing protein [Jannaschia aquimarina]KIT15736.1 von Willebrand factor type A domain protein [Jannaschia aquimarina]